MIKSMIVMSVVAIFAASTVAGVNLQITEVYEGVSGEDVTCDWVEITNLGDTDFTFPFDLYYDDNSADPTTDEMVTGITDITAGESVVVVLGNGSSVVTDFINTWGLANLAGVEIGYLTGDDPAGLSQGGESLYFFDDNTAGANTVISAAYTGINNGGTAGSTWWDAAGDGEVFDSSVSGSNGAFTAPVAAGDWGEFPLVGSPGSVPEPASMGLLALGGMALIRRWR